MALVQLHFFNFLYSGVMDIQDQIFLQNKLGEFEVNGINMKSIDGKITWHYKTETLVQRYTGFLS